MAILLKKAWGSVLNLSGSTSSRSSSDLSPEISSLGAFDQLPIDISMEILRLIGPRAAARMSAVSKSWRILVSDNSLWSLKNGKEPFDSVVFAETYLRLGRPSLMYFEYSPPLSFMNIYAEREKVPGSVIIDGGSGYCKYGWSKYPIPFGHCATFLEFGNIESPMYSRLRHFFSTIYKRMLVKPFSQPIIVSIPICHSDDTEAARASRRQLKEAIHTVLFDMNAPAVCAVDQSHEELFSLLNENS